ncbi:MAG: diguanylate cyclase [Acidobacteria bacterium]|nr:diguanylate cyclase [Acidobacteriota bacterium]
MKINTRRLKSAGFIWILCLMISSTAFPQGNIRFRNVSIAQGLSQNSLFTIAQDQQGFMWFGTEEGANRYDGYTMRIFRPERGNPNSISNNWIYCIREDRQGKIWFGTDNGLNSFDRETERFKHFMAQLDNPEALISNRIYSLMEDLDGVLWIGTDRGLHTLNADRTRLTRILFEGTDRETAAANDIRTIIQDRNGSIWVGTYGGGLRYRDVKSREWTTFAHDPSRLNSLIGNNVLHLAQDRNGEIWIGTQNGLDRLDPGHGMFTHYAHDPKNAFSLSDDWVNCIYEDGDGDLWIGTNEGGLNLYRRKTDDFTHSIYDPSDSNSLSADRILSIFQDQSGLIWIGTYGGGLSYFQKSSIRFLHIQTNPQDPNSIINNHIRAFLEDGPDRLFIGAESGGVNIIDRKQGTTIVLAHDPGDPDSLGANQVYSIIKDHQGTIWMGTYGGGLNRFNPADRTFTRFPHRPDDPNSPSHDNIRTLRPSRDGGLWIGLDGGGVNYFDPSTGRFTRYLADPSNPNSLALNRVLTLTEDPQSGILWIGTFGAGLDRFDPQTGMFRNFRAQEENPNSLNNNYILCIHIDQQGIFWIGTAGGGLTRFDPRQETFHSYTRNDGLPNNTVYGILEDDDGNLWMSSNQGISKFNPKLLTCKNYDVSDGLQNMEFNGGAYYRGPSGWMYFGGITGFNAFHPQNIADNPFIPPVAFTRIQIMNKDVGIGDIINGRKILDKAVNVTEQITLTAKDRVVSFEFAALSFLAPEKNQYAYQLEGFDKDWNPVGTRRFISYTNLPPRKYRLVVKASNNDGRWNEQGAVLSITVIPPVWRMWWFKILLILAAALLVLSIIRMRTRAIINKRNELEALVRLRTKELQDAHREMEKLTITDALTGLYNRRYFQDRVRKDAALAVRQTVRKPSERSSNSLGFLMIDIDFFKRVNDTLGHDVGDQLLKGISERFNRTVRASDTLARWGGEEFLVMSKENDLEAAGLLAERLRRAVADTPFLIAENSIFKTISIGYCVFPFIVLKTRLLTWEETVQIADKGLLIAKNSGRNRSVGVEVLNEDLSSDDVALLKSDLPAAVKNGLVKLRLGPADIAPPK